MQLSSSKGGVAPTLVLGILVRMIYPARVSAENRLATKYENYHEEHGRIEVQTFGLYVESSLLSSLTAKGEFVYDAISGATPTGGPPLPGEDQVPLAQMDDIRRAGVFELNQRWGRQTFSPQVAYSTESDYESIGLALNYSLELNDKNTTLLAGIARNFDRILPGNSFLFQTSQKDTLDFLVGVTQLLGPHTILTANLTIGFSDGYLSDPYKGVRFQDYPFYEALFPENRPDNRDRQIGYISLKQFVEPVNGSAEAAYRISNDSFGVLSHTASLDWHQKLGSIFVLTPFGRYYKQSEADFYGLSFPGDPSLSMDGVPDHYSSDYRLSDLTSWTYGIKLSCRFDDVLEIDAAFKRYEMRGKDSVTPASAYPTANIFSLGLSIWF